MSAPPGRWQMVASCDFFLHILFMFIFFGEVFVLLFTWLWHLAIRLPACISCCISDGLLTNIYILLSKGRCGVMELVDLFFCHLFFYFLGLLCLRSYTLSSMIITALMMISFPHAIMQKKPPFAAMSLYMGLVGQMSRQYYNLPTLSMHTSDSINPS